MGTVKKINFPYYLDSKQTGLPLSERIVVFFGTDFYNLPLDSDRSLYIETTNKMLDYIRRNFAGRKLIYNPHPNESDEYTLLDTAGFTIGEHTIAELFLFKNASNIEYVFSSCSGASVSALAMRFPSAIFLETLQGSVTDDTIIGYRSYFAGFPDALSIKSFADPLPELPASLFPSANDFKEILNAVKDSKKIFFMGNEPGNLAKIASLAKFLRQDAPDKKLVLIKMKNRRWDMIPEHLHLLDLFDEVIELALPSVRYSARPSKIRAAVESFRYLKNLPIGGNDAIVSFSFTQFEENCLMSYFKKSRKILFIGYGWYHFIFEDGYKDLKKADYHSSYGELFFRYILAPILGLYGAIYKEHKDGKVINYFRYVSSLEKVYDDAFVLMPSSEK